MTKRGKSQLEQGARRAIRNMRRDGVVRRTRYLYSRGKPVGTVTVERRAFNPFTGK